MEFEFLGPDLNTQLKFFAGSIAVTCTIAATFSFSHLGRVPMDMVFAVASSALVQSSVSFLSALPKIRSNVRSGCLLLSFTPFPGLVAGVAALGIRHLLF